MGELKLEELDQANEADVAFVFETRRHPAVVPMLFGEPPKTLEDHKVWLAANVPKRRLMFVLKDGGKPVGYCHASSRGWEVELGFVVHPSFQGRGNGEFMVRELARKAGSRNRIMLRVRADNAVARRVYERCGFKSRRTVEEGGVAKVEYELR